MFKLPRKQRQIMKRQAESRSTQFRPAPRSEWPIQDNPDRKKVWVNNQYLVQEFKEGRNTRLSINRTQLQPDGHWKQEISWDDIQSIKNQLGYGNRYAIEIYPREQDVVNVANMRHLWVLCTPLKIGWFSKSSYQDNKPHLIFEAFTDYYCGEFNITPVITWTWPVEQLDNIRNGYAIAISWGFWDIMIGYAKINK